VSDTKSNDQRSPGRKATGIGVRVKWSGKFEQRAKMYPT